MSDYLFLTNVGDEIVSSVHLSKFVPNRESQSRVDIDYKVGIYTQKFENVFYY